MLDEAHRFAMLLPTRGCHFIFGDDIVLSLEMIRQIREHYQDTFRFAERNILDSASVLRIYLFVVVSTLFSSFVV